MSELYVNTIYPQSGNEIAVSGNLNVSGTFKAYQFETIVHNSTTYLGDTIFGNNNTDHHQFNGNVSGSGYAIFVTGITTAGDLNVSGSTSLGSISAVDVSGSGKGIFAGGVEAQGDIQTSGSLYARHNVSGSGKGLFVLGIETAGNTYSTGSMYTLHNVSGSGKGLFVSGIETAGTLSVTGSSTFRGNLLPVNDAATDLGSSSKRWANVHTADLHLKNERGDWTIVEEEDYLSVINNKTKKRYKMMLEEIKD